MLGCGIDDDIIRSCRRCTIIGVGVALFLFDRIAVCVNELPRKTGCGRSTESQISTVVAARQHFIRQRNRVIAVAAPQRHGFREASGIVIESRKVVSGIVCDDHLVLARSDERHFKIFDAVVHQSFAGLRVFIVHRHKLTCSLRVKTFFDKLFVCVVNPSLRVVGVGLLQSAADLVHIDPIVAVGKTAVLHFVAEVIGACLGHGKSDFRLHFGIRFHEVDVDILHGDGFRFRFFTNGAGVRLLAVARKGGFRCDGAFVPGMRRFVKLLVAAAHGAFVPMVRRVFAPRRIRGVNVRRSRITAHVAGRIRVVIVNVRGKFPLLFAVFARAGIPMSRFVVRPLLGKPVFVFAFARSKYGRSQNESKHNAQNRFDRFFHKILSYSFYFFGGVRRP